MAKIFISYRREDSQYQTDKLYELLSRYIVNPRENIFLDVDNIPFGIDFVEYLDGKVSECEILLAVIGKGWLTSTDPETGQRRIDSPKDFVRIEIASALERGIPVVPVLLDGAPVPPAHNLPDDLKALSRRNGIVVTRQSFDGDIASLVDGLPIDLGDETGRKAKGGPKTVPRGRRVPLIGTIAFLILVIGGSLGLWRTGILSFQENDQSVQIASGIPSTLDSLLRLKFFLHENANYKPQTIDDAIKDFLRQSGTQIEFETVTALEPAKLKLLEGSLNEWRVREWQRISPADWNEFSSDELYQRVSLSEPVEDFVAAADAGNVNAMAILGYKKMSGMFYFGYGKNKENVWPVIDSSKRDGESYLVEACARGHPDSCGSLATRRGADNSGELRRKACDDGAMWSCRHYGKDRVESGDLELGLDYLSTACSGRNFSACAILLDLYEENPTQTASTIAPLVNHMEETCYQYAKDYGENDQRLVFHTAPDVVSLCDKVSEIKRQGDKNLEVNVDVAAAELLFESGTSIVCKLLPERSHERSCTT